MDEGGVLGVLVGWGWGVWLGCWGVLFRWGGGLGYGCWPWLGGVGWGVGWDRGYRVGAGEGCTAYPEPHADDEQEVGGDDAHVVGA